MDKNYKWKLQHNGEEFTNIKIVSEDTSENISDDIYKDGKIIENALYYGSNDIDTSLITKYNSDVIIKKGAITKIDNKMFRNNKIITSIIIPEGVTEIEQSAFKECTSLESVIIPKSVTSIKSWTFEDCSSLIDITIPTSVTSIGSYAFEGCTELESIAIPEGITSIESGTFRNCTNLRSITIPEGVSFINDNTFDGCSNLRSITLPSTIVEATISPDYSYMRLAHIKYRGTKEDLNKVLKIYGHNDIHIKYI